MQRHEPAPNRAQCRRRFFRFGAAKTENPPKSRDLQRVSQTTAVVEFCGARERTRTFTAVKPPAPEAGASTNFATRALRKEIMK